ncbi:MAG: UDP-2,3-diacylglucosamine diphosphatase [Rikenellaceae bacterium]
MYYFVSDIHLGAGDRAEERSVERRFVAWLDSVSADAKAIFLCGDIFDFWFEYGRVIPKGFVRTLGKFAELSDRGVRLVYMAGNHDMWLGEYLAQECGVEIFFKPEVFELAGKRVHVAHGDNLNVRRDVMLQFVNFVFRSSVVRWVFKWMIHPDLAMRFGQWWSGASRKRHRRLPGHGTIDGHGVKALVEYAQGVQRSQKCDYFIYGHLHQSLSHSIDGAEVLFLCDWSEEPTVAILDDAGVMKLERI